MRNERRKHLSRVRRVVVKVGSSLLTDDKRRGVSLSFLRRLAQEIGSLRKSGVQCLVVTSGAIAAGLFELGLRKKPKEMAKLQALAAVGQCTLMQAYETTFRRHSLKVAQLLLTREDLSDPRRYANAHHTLEELFRHGIIPVVNENDTVAVEEIRFGDNDTLAALVTRLAKAGLLILLTDTEGLFDEDPRVNASARLLSSVWRVDRVIEGKATGSRSRVGTGGMGTKVRAAKSLMRAGIPMVIANGSSRRVLRRILKAESIGTFFHPASPPKKRARK